MTKSDPNRLYCAALPPYRPVNPSCASYTSRTSRVWEAVPCYATALEVVSQDVYCACAPSIAHPVRSTFHRPPSTMRCIHTLFIPTAITYHTPSSHVIYNCLHDVIQNTLIRLSFDANDPSHCQVERAAMTAQGKLHLVKATNRSHGNRGVFYSISVVRCVPAQQRRVIVVKR